ncbi:hypothetical protein NECID01_1089 [Nematocida sp. AWRm77]|nr:hypothetical protein NECID01_1089 [Nematocida sp. AWRm77]
MKNTFLWLFFGVLCQMRGVWTLQGDKKIGTWKIDISLIRRNSLDGDLSQLLFCVKKYNQDIEKLGQIKDKYFSCFVFRKLSLYELFCVSFRNPIYKTVFNNPLKDRGCNAEEKFKRRSLKKKRDLDTRWSMFVFNLEESKEDAFKSMPQTVTTALIIDMEIDLYKDLQALKNMGFQLAVVVSPTTKLKNVDAQMRMADAFFSLPPTLDGLEFIDSLNIGDIIDATISFTAEEYKNVRIERSLLSNMYIPQSVLCICVVGLFLILAMFIIRLYIDQTRRTIANKHDTHTFSLLRSLPLFLYRRHLTSIDMTDCPICLEQYTGSSLCRVLPCEHFFHQNCIDPWIFERSLRCPCCQHVINTPPAPT